MNSEILDQLTNLERDVHSAMTKPKIGRKKKYMIWKTMT